MGSGCSVYNLGGRVGVWSVDVLMLLFGYLVYLFFLLIVYCVWLVFCDVGKFWNWLLVGLWFFGFIMMMVVVIGLVYIYFDVVDGILFYIDFVG